jgi:prolyl 4-hydroxylase
MVEVDKTKPFILTLPDVLSAEECTTFINRIESLKPEIASINTFSGTRVRSETRNNDRVIFDDAHLAQLLVARVQNKVPAEIHGMALIGANERFRCYRYKPGMRFAPHTDGAYFRTETEYSCYTFLVYLNDDFDGGETTFLTEPEIKITPESGMGLIFQHPLIHEGSLVTRGIKYVARTDLMYQKAS